MLGIKRAPPAKPREPTPLPLPEMPLSSASTEHEREDQTPVDPEPPTVREHVKPGFFKKLFGK
jgi:hypothetical protein